MKQRLRKLKGRMALKLATAGVAGAALAALVIPASPAGAAQGAYFTPAYQGTCEYWLQWNFQQPQDYVYVIADNPSIYGTVTCAWQFCVLFGKYLQPATYHWTCYPKVIASYNNAGRGYASGRAGPGEIVLNIAISDAPVVPPPYVYCQQVNQLGWFTTAPRTSPAPPCWV